MLKHLIKSIRSAFGVIIDSIRHPWARTKHHWIEATIAVLCAVIANDLINLYVRPNDYVGYIDMAAMVLVLAVFVAGRQHAGARDIKIRGRVVISAKLFGGTKTECCDYCLTQTSKVPADPQAAAQRKRRRLKLTRYLNDVVKWWGILAYIAADYAVCWLVMQYSSATNAILAGDLFILGFVYMTLSVRTHIILQGWCPQCKNGGQQVMDEAPSAPIMPTPLPA